MNATMRSALVLSVFAIGSLGCAHPMHSMHGQQMSKTAHSQGMACCSMCSGMGMKRQAAGALTDGSPAGGGGAMGMAGMSAGNARLPGSEPQAMACSAEGGCGAQGGMCGCCGTMGKPKA